MKRKRFSRLLFLMLTIMITVTLYQPVQAASGKYTGTYTKTWSVSSNMTVTIKPSYSVIVNKVTSTKVRLQLEKLGVNGSPIYATAPITAKRKGNTVSFKWKDTWGNSGTGTLKLYKGYVKLKVKQTYTARWNRSTLDTSGKYMKIYRKSGNTKMDNIDCVSGFRITETNAHDISAINSRNFQIIADIEIIDICKSSDPLQIFVYSI